MIDTGLDWSRLIEYGELLISETSEHSQFEALIDLLQDVIRCQAYIVTFDLHNDSLEEIFANRSDIPQNIKLLMVNSIEDRETQVINNQNPLENGKSYHQQEKNQKEKINVIATPIGYDDHVFGVCAIIRTNGTFFSTDEAEFFEFLVSYSAIIIHTNFAFSADQRKFELLKLVSEVSSQITQLDNLDVLSDNITRIVQKIFDYYYVAIFTLETDSNVLTFRSGTGGLQSKGMDVSDGIDGQGNLLSSPMIEVYLGEGIIGTVAKNGIAIIANDVTSNPYYRHEDILPETKSEAALPIKIGGKILGVLDVQSDKKNAFRDEDLLVLKGLSDNIAIGLENSRLYVDLQRRHSQLKSIYDVSNAITSVLNFDDLLEQAIQLMQKSLGYSSVHFYTYNPTSGDLVYQKGCSDQSQPILSYEFSISIDSDNSSVPWVARNLQPLLINDITERSELLPTAPGAMDIRSELVVPLVFADRLLGVIEIQSDQPDIFNADDLYVVEALADNIAIALRNSNLYRSEQWRRRVADSLNEVAGLLSADISLDQVINRILDELINTIPSIVASIWLLDELDVYEGAELESKFILSAIRSSTDIKLIDNNKGLDLLYLLGLGIDELINNYGLESSVKLWLLEGINSNTPIIRNLNSPYEPIGALLEFDPNYSAIIAPLRIGERSLGALTLIHDRPGRYGENAQLLSTTFANYAAVAIENTRLYEAAHDQAWVSTVLLQVTQAMQSIDSLDQLLQTIVQILPELIGARSCAILLWDETASLFVPGIAHGFSPQQYEEFENWYIGEFEVPAFDKIRETKAPVVIDHSVISENNVDLIFKSFDFSSSLYLLFPMITQNEVIGTILVDLRDEDSQLLGESSLWEEKILIIQGVANQTAIAIANIQLVKAQEEEAYVSIALLQVAQAIVSSNDLDEILSSIVRITPILVGVRRSIIFLWDDANGIFRISQAYGFTREDISEMQPFYSCSDFPLLDFVHQNNKIAYYSFKDALDPSQWSMLSIDDLSSVEGMDVGFEEETQKKEDFQSKSTFLMGFPLSIKGNVLGIMLIEDVDQRSHGLWSHIRERRTEILTGITQQAAVAIQNDILQRDVLERERLEREMQLAREIQSTFLPDHLPTIEGWDLDVRWRPARQVGGDFYDIFELPNNNLGIVIADVADKGMPAALYMTLVRTLIRAAIHDRQSPREVLTRVNNLLVPDSRQGMFVTVVYAVLSLDTGKVAYVNAGHNPPLSIKSSGGKISEHVRSAMALGVFHDVEIKESEIILDQGDLLLLYTDGITEAFSNMEEIFGLDRLKEILMQSKYDSASSLLDIIESTVIEFSDGLSQSDDITLVAIYRRR
jgi:sigma-B regulation protein RsbU (phosphoserine phosphatase)